MSLTLTINGTNRIGRVQLSSLQLGQVLTSQVDTLTFTMQLPDSQTAEIPRPNQEVILTETGGVKLFAGIVVSQPVSLPGDGRYGELIVSVTCHDYQTQLTRRLAVRAYENQTAGAIVLDLLTIVSGSGFTVGLVETGPTLPKWTINYQNVADAIAQLALSVGFEWYVDYDKRVYFFDNGGNAAAAWNLTEDTATPPLASAPYGNLSYTEDVTQIRNVVTVRGARTASQLQTQRQFADGTQRQFPLIYGQPVVGSLVLTIAGTPQSIGEEGKADPATVDWLVNYQNRSVFATSGTSTPSSGALVLLTYRYETQIIVTARDPDSVAVYGDWENIIVNDAITDRTIAERVAKADLANYAWPQTGLSYTTTRPGLEVGKRQRVTLPKIGLDADFLIYSIAMNLEAYITTAQGFQSANRYFKRWRVDARRIGRAI